MAHAKVINSSKPVTFSSLQKNFDTLLDQIKVAAPKGTKDGASAYATASSGKPKLDANNQPVKDSNGSVVKDVKGVGDYVGDVVHKLTAEQIGWVWSGLELSSPPEKRAQDVINSVSSTWDKAAAKYMKNDISGGDSERKNIAPRLKEFDDALSSKGGTPVKKDE